MLVIGLEELSKTEYAGTGRKAFLIYTGYRTGQATSTDRNSETKEVVEEAVFSQSQKVRPANSRDWLYHLGPTNWN